MIYLEDLIVGETKALGSYDVTREEVIAFATSYDPQPFHLSDEEASKTHFGRLAASGWHTAAMTMAVIVRNLTANAQVGLGSPGVDTLRWLKPVHPDDTLNVSSRIIEVTPSRSKPQMGSYRSEIEVTNQYGQPVMTFTSIALMRRKPSSDDLPVST